MPRFAQYGQDALVGDVLFRGRSGVFVDVGARDGVLNSNTVYLERELGWTGVAIEPHPDLFSKLAASRRCRCINVAASDEAREGLQFVKFLEEPFGNSGLLSTFLEPKRLKTIKHEMISVPTAPLSAILKDITHIDYLDIDVEGHEMPVLNGINFEAVAIKVIGVECIDNSKKAQMIDEFLSEKGFYPFTHLRSDRFYCQSSEVRSAGDLCKLLEK